MNQLKRPLFRLIAGNVLLTSLIFSPFEGKPQQAPQGRLLALSKADHTLAIVDPLTLKVIKRIPVGQYPHEVVASSDGKTAYVSIYNGGSTHELNIIDLVAQKPLSNVDTRPLYGPHGLAFANGKVWFSAEGSKSVGCYDPASGTVDWSMGTGQDRTHMIEVTDDGKKIYTTNVASGTLSILEDPRVTSSASGKSAEEWRQTIVPTAKGSEGFDVSPDGTQLWTAASDDGTISIIDLRTRRLDAKFDGKTLGANRLKFTEDGKLVLVSSLRTGDLTIYNAKTHSIVKRLKIGRGAAGILVEPGGARAFIASSADNFVAVVDLKTLEIIQQLDVGGVPDGLAWAVMPK